MALTIEDGQGLANAQSLASVAELRAWAGETGDTLPSADRDCERLLVKGMRRMMGLNYRGQLARRDQALPFPRVGIVIEGYALDPTVIPKKIKDAQCAYAMAARTAELQPLIPANAKGAVISETIGPISRTFANNGGTRELPAVPVADALLKGFTIGSSVSVMRS